VTREILHGTCVAYGTSAALLRGGSGAGKSDLALRFLALPSEPGEDLRLIADDQVCVEAATDGTLRVSPPKTIAGKIEVRGVGIVEMPHLKQGRLVLVVDLVGADEVPRMPPEPRETVTVAGIAVPRLKLAPFEGSAAVKLRLALLQAGRANKLSRRRFGLAGAKHPRHT
jgi:HPr kinase/phosphorylase